MKEALYSPFIKRFGTSKGILLIEAHPGLDDPITLPNAI
jgi:hypothetical protein